MILSGVGTRTGADVDGIWSSAWIGTGTVSTRSALAVRHEITGQIKRCCNIL